MPVTDEKAPKTTDFAILAARAWDPPEGAALLYNCQMGRGRTTTGMIIASLIILRRRLSNSKGMAQMQHANVLQGRRRRHAHAHESAVHIRRHALGLSIELSSAQSTGE